MTKACRLLVCGDRNWSDAALVGHVIDALDPAVVIHGCASGADSIAATHAHARHLVVYGFRAQWRKYGKGAGPLRNQRMLDEGRPDMVVAFHDDLTTSRGTKDMIERAQAAGVPTYTVAHRRDGGTTVMTRLMMQYTGDKP